MSVVRRHICEFCGHEFLKRLSGPTGVFGSHSACPSCGKSPTIPPPSGKTFPMPFVTAAKDFAYTSDQLTVEPLPLPPLGRLFLEE